LENEPGDAHRLIPRDLRAGEITPIDGCGFIPPSQHQGGEIGWMGVFER
jgi:hypothetical protein